MDIFNKFKGTIKIKQVQLDNEVFQLHYKVTTILLLACGGLVASKQHFGDPIECIMRDDVPNKLMNTYCWIHATFTLPDACNRTVGYEIPHPCVDKFVREKEERIYHKYYQWVYFVLFFQAACFYAPHWFWKNCESKLLLNLTSELTKPIPKELKKAREHLTIVVEYFKRHRSQHQMYFFYFVLCEILNLLNVIMQIYLVDAFLGGTFTTYGLDVIDYIQLEQTDRVDPMVRIFPRLTKCTFHKFGSSGDVQQHDALCLLPLNIINEKIYVAMWFWFVFLAFITSLWIVYRILSLIKKDLRYKVIARRATHANKKDLGIVLGLLETGDWFLLSMLCKNIDAHWFRLLISRLGNVILEEQQDESLNDESGHEAIEIKE